MVCKQEEDSFKEECGVFGVYNSEDAAAYTVLGLHALQHRGQEAAGIVSCDKDMFFIHKATGHVGDNFNSKKVIDSLSGNSSIGHVRYSTSGGSESRNIQPIFAEFSFGGLAIAHNGNLTNALYLRQELTNKGAIFQSTMDSEVFIHLIAMSKYEKVIDRFTDALMQIEGAYSLAVLTRKKLVAARDPMGIRPLVLGKLGDSYIIASETCALDINGAKYIRDVEPGELIIIDEDGLSSSFPLKKLSKKFCIFEYVYFARPDSYINQKYVYEVRKNIGKELANEALITGDVVVPVPDSGVPAALGFAYALGIPFEFGIIRNHYVGRTFIEPTDSIRNLGVKLKHNANPVVLKGKKVILVDDSIIRGTTSKKIVAMVREAGALEVHMVIASPPTISPCYYGVDTPKKDKLMAANYTVEEMAKIIGVESLHFISMEGLYKAVNGSTSTEYCDACFTANYPFEIKDKDIVYSMSREN